MNEIIDKTPCNTCSHEEVCSHKIIHAANVKEISAYVDVNSSLDTIYVQCHKFAPVGSIFRPKVLGGAVNTSMYDTRDSGDFRDNCEQFKDK